MSSIDINCDLGESFGQFIMGNDDAVFPHISSCNIACGFHGGDPLHIENTIKKALHHKVQIGAHPSYPDLAGFGRRKILLSAEELKASVKYQISALMGMVKALGGELKYIKAHGALYNSIAHDEKEAKTFLFAVKEINPDLAILGLSASPFEGIAQSLGFQFIREGFLDRCYQDDGSLMPRKEKGSVLESVEESLNQFISIAQKREVETASGKRIPMQVDSLCIHGDNPLAEDILKAIHQLDQSITVKCIQL
ncbi:5-oxoprolinase subunit PxpA [Marivirga salinae]|uniref:5-oxoprolinase subunit PxpA n=1 Tax=Marivirga salinarum TaxID=3059078 RepID=A0AA51RBZ9_9BACT|nr:5-oxoprolinase subunit PxpA [Marivirga sp. BDSF4-3]WMN11088.1 5-oxoprolinase subunit PxpA [Marivirga sp. BDSF4-3]